MLFNSVEFALFLPIVFILYWFLAAKNLKLQNALIVGASYFFYGCWDWRCLSLILFSTVVDYAVGRGLATAEKSSQRKLLLAASLIVNLGLLGFFKYYNFFLDNFIAAFSFFGVGFSASSLKIILPVGISFYTFQTLSYSIDVYRKKLQPTDDFIAFAAFVSFFPQLVAGPIERATHLLPQFYTPRVFDYSKAVDGMRQILWGLTKKVVIADNCAEFANLIFNNYTDYSGSTLVIGAIFFSFQIYGDFSGYSDIAIGTSRLFGFDLMKNFAFPYFSRDIAEFWRRWHISLSTWFRDYLYIPLGGSRGGTSMRLRNTFIIFIVSGFWHGANWTFIVWGALNAIYFLPLLLTNNNRNNLGIVAENRMLPTVKEFIQMSVTFGLSTLAWIFFRADNLGHAMSYLGTIFSPSLLSIPEVRPSNVLALLMLFVLIEWVGRRDEYAFQKIAANKGKALRFFTYCLLVFVLFYFTGKSQQFIYFQF